MSGGKSLELMQRRMANGQPAPPGGDNPAGGNPHPSPATTQAPFPGGQEVGGSPQQHINMNPRPGKSSSALMATQAREQGSQQHPLPSPNSGSMAQAPVGPPGGRPKGKDFAAMTMSKPSPLVAPAPQELPPQQQQQQPPLQMPPSGGGAGRPKGKDFGAMASRMGNTAPMPQQQPQLQPLHQPQPPLMQQQSQQNQHLQPHPDADAQRLRAQQMQAAARAAAGLPPLDHYTATSVTTVPPPITTTKPTQQARTPTLYAQQQQVPQASQQQQPYQYQPPQASPVGQPQAQQPSLVPGMQQQVPYQQQQAASQQQQQQQHQQPPPQRKPGGKPTVVARQTSAPRRPSLSTPKSTKPTPQPIAPEARVSLTTKHPQPTLVGPKLQDLVKSIDPSYTMDAEAEEQVLQLADDFLENVTKQSLLLAQHRGSKTLDVQDIQLVLAKHWGISVPGLGLPTLRPLKPGKVNLTVGGGTSKRKSPSSSSSSAADAAKKKMTGVPASAVGPGESSTASFF